MLTAEAGYLMACSESQGLVELVKSIHSSAP